MDRRDAGAPHQGHNAEIIELVTELTDSMAVITQQVESGSCQSRFARFATLYRSRYLHRGERETDDHARTIYQDRYKIFQLSFFMAGEFIIVEGVKEG